MTSDSERMDCCQIFGPASHHPTAEEEKFKVAAITAALLKGMPTMGTWNITIDGMGSHHNGPDAKADAEKIAKEFARALLDAGHSVREARFTVKGGKDDDLLLGLEGDLADVGSFYRRWKK